MEKEKLKDKDYAKELVGIIRKDLQENNKKELIETVSDYHENDIAEALTRLTVDERKKLYPILGVERIAEIFAYLDEDEQKFLKELSIDNIAKVVSEMDSDDAVDILENMEQSTKEEIVKRLDKDAGEDVRMLLSYDEDEIGSCMTTNYICIHEDLNIRQAMSELVRQAGENDNISTIYVVDKNDLFCGAIDLKDLIIARDYENLDDLIIRSYPYVLDHENISDCLDQIREYAEDSIPVLTQEGKIVGIITSSDIIEVVDDEMGDDYAKLAGLTAEEDLREKTLESMKKRLPWLIILLFLGMAVSSVVGAFENVVAVLPIVICFQSLILDMAGNVGTQSLAVTIRVLMDENLTGKQKFLLVMKEMKIGLLNGVFLGIMAFLILGLYISYFKHYDLPHAFLISGCVGIALIVSMVISSFVGTVIPMFFHKIKVDPAVASGPLITTVNDLVAVVTYYGLSLLFLIHIFHVAG
ncbi:MAG: magnesium transporter [Lachnospiraceae bacterium]|nr:magnesium transporter [Lachnospiraceae bacterium]MDD5854073.1 magnesium transporter [Lachnospiraceae bacterium]